MCYDFLEVEYHMRLTDWRLEDKARKIRVPAQVPGDVTWDLFRAEKIEDPFFGLNHRELKWVAETDFVYSTEFSLSEKDFGAEELLLEFDSVDTFSEIFLNGVRLGATENMFLKYSFSIREIARKENNLLEVHMKNVYSEMDRIDDRGYFGIFNVKRLFLRKAQCHFGWDWAPNMPGYGLCGAVNVFGVSRCRMNDVFYVSDCEGNLTLSATLNFNPRPYIDFRGNVISNVSSGEENDVLRWIVGKKPGETLDPEDALVLETRIEGAKNFVNFHFENPALWWPSGYGEQPLYPYRVEFYNGDRLLDCREGTFAFREVELVQKPIDFHRVGFRLKINGREIFVRGSNWVPIECFSGIAEEEKYETMLRLARDANVNMLRVWGGGLYERDCFYEICDRLGVMVWQDLMFACADIPDHDPEFTENVGREINYQVRRLRNHPSLVYWCGGNEKTGSFGLQISHGDYFTDVVLRGLVTSLDATRPFMKQSPCSLSDIGNDFSSGESHAGSFEEILIEGPDSYRRNIAAKKISFVSECALMGPNSVETNRKIYPKEKLWPMNEYWSDRLMENPYSTLDMNFATRMKRYAEGFYGTCESLRDFTAKGMLVHSEALRAECESARARKQACGGFLNWMWADTWPQGTWSTVDYYLEPKSVYYQMRRSYAPLLVSFFEDERGQTRLFAVNDTGRRRRIEIRYGCRTPEGQTLFCETVRTEVGTARAEMFDLPEPLPKGAYLFAEYEGEKTLYSPDFWRNQTFSSDYRVRTELTDERHAAVTVSAKRFAKAVSLSFPDNGKYRFSDNYFDLEAGEERTVSVESETPIDPAALCVTDFAKETCRG